MVDCDFAVILIGIGEFSFGLCWISVNIANVGRFGEEFGYGLSLKLLCNIGFHFQSGKVCVFLGNFTSQYHVPCIYGKGEGIGIVNITSQYHISL